MQPPVSRPPPPSRDPTGVATSCGGGLSGQTALGQGRRNGTSEASSPGTARRSKRPGTVSRADSSHGRHRPLACHPYSLISVLPTADVSPTQQLATAWIGHREGHHADKTRQGLALTGSNRSPCTSLAEVDLLPCRSFPAARAYRPSGRTARRRRHASSRRRGRHHCRPGGAQERTATGRPGPDCCTFFSALYSINPTLWDKT